MLLEHTSLRLILQWLIRHILGLGLDWNRTLLNLCIRIRTQWMRLLIVSDFRGSYICSCSMSTILVLLFILFRIVGNIFRLVRLVLKLSSHALAERGRSTHYRTVFTGFISRSHWCIMRLRLDIRDISLTIFLPFYMLIKFVRLWWCRRDRLRWKELFVNLFGKITREISVKHLMVHLVDIDLKIKLAEISFLFNFLDISSFRLPGKLNLCDTSVFKHLIKLSLKDGLIDCVLSLLELFTTVHIVDYLKNVETVATKVKHFQIGLDLILCFLP